MPRGLDRRNPTVPRTYSPVLLLPLAAVLAITPLLLHGCSCGHDFVFHMQSWLDAARQLRHGKLYPRWAFVPAWNAGEPRFVFYPPLSWMLGALLTMIFPASAAPTIYIWIALTAAGLSMYYLAIRLAGPGLSSRAALLAATLYLANPYMLFNAFERSAFAELLAAAWIPLLLLAVLRPRPTVRGVALPVALLWLTNAPAAVMGCYALALLASVRLIAAIHSRKQQAVSLASTFIAGSALGLALPALYLVPAAFERRYVQVAMAIIPNMRFQDNFLFSRTDNAPHNAVVHTVSILAIGLLLATVAVISALLLKPSPLESAGWGERANPTAPKVEAPVSLATPLAILTFALTFLLVPLSTPVWQHLPELAFLQFPWRLLTILAAVLGLSLALLLVRLPSGRETGRESPSAATSLDSSPRRTAMTLGAFLLPPAISFLCFHFYGQACEPNDRPSAVAALLRTHHGAGPTDEYTPNDADNDVLRSDDPGYWLLSDPQAFAPYTIPNPNASNPDYDRPTPVDQTLSAPAPLRLRLDLPRPEYLVLNLRDYPDWRLTDNGSEPAHIERNDGLLAVAVPAGVSTIAITWRYTPDQEIGLALSGCALVAFAFTFRRG